MDRKEREIRKLEEKIRALRSAIVFYRCSPEIPEAEKERLIADIHKKLKVLKGRVV